MRASEINEMLEDGTFWVRDYAPGLTPADPSLDVPGLRRGEVVQRCRLGLGIGAVSPATEEALEPRADFRFTTRSAAIISHVPRR